MEDQERALKLATEAGHILLENGAEISRVEAAVCFMFIIMNKIQIIFVLFIVVNKILLFLHGRIIAIWN